MAPWGASLLCQNHWTDEVLRAESGDAVYPGLLFEIRAIGKEGIGRAFFCTMREKRIIVLHAFTKKTARTPEREIRIAHKRLKELSREKQEEPW
jgi:phage-related protein